MAEKERKGGCLTRSLGRGGDPARRGDGGGADRRLVVVWRRKRSARRGSGNSTRQSPNEDVLRWLQSSLAEVFVVVDGRMARFEVAETWLDEVEAWRWRWLGLPAGWWQASSAAPVTAA
jgi:hypothetical protein